MARKKWSQGISTSMQAQLDMQRIGEQRRIAPGSTAPVYRNSQGEPLPPCDLELTPRLFEEYLDRLEALPAKDKVFKTLSQLTSYRKKRTRNPEQYEAWLAQQSRFKNGRRVHTPLSGNELFCRAVIFLLEKYEHLSPKSITENAVVSDAEFIYQRFA